MIELKEINEVDLEPYQQYLPDSLKSDFNKFGGIEHYRLLSLLSKGKALVYDIGTYRGSSAVAMSSAKKVVSYDILAQRTAKKPKNVIFKIGEALEDDNILKADVILLDTYHDGGYENKFYSFLVKGEYKGVLIVDDIRLNAEMMRFWSGINERKEDLTSVGHYSGTGIVYFNSKSVKRCSNCG
jgi:hypothetical protein